MEYTFRTPDDMHVHFRQGEMLKTVVPYTAGVFRRALVMPNTTPAILTGDDVRRYQTEIMKAVHDCFKPLKVASAYERFQPLMTIKLTGDTTPMMIEDAFEAGAIAVKLYPEGVTTNSEDGVSVENIEKLYPVFRAMANCGMVLSVHGEVPGVPILRRESAFLAIFNKLDERLQPNLAAVQIHQFNFRTRKVVSRWNQVQKGKLGFEDVPRGALWSPGILFEKRFIQGRFIADADAYPLGRIPLRVCIDE